MCNQIARTGVVPVVAIEDPGQAVCPADRPKMLNDIAAHKRAASAMQKVRNFHEAQHV